MLGFHTTHSFAGASTSNIGATVAAAARSAPPPTHSDEGDARERPAAPGVRSGPWHALRSSFVLPSPVLLTRASLSLAAVLFAVTMVVNFDASVSCFTVSCVTDYTEVADRIGAIAFFAFGVGVWPVYATLAVPSVMVLLDSVASFLLAVGSIDVVGDAHVPIVLAYVWIRLTIIAAYVHMLPLWGNYLVHFAIPTIGHVFFYGYACPHVIPEVCGTVRLVLPFTPQLVMFTETSILVLAIAVCASATVAPSGLVRISRVPAVSLFASSLLTGAVAVVAVIGGENWYIVPLFFACAAISAFQGRTSWRHGRGCDAPVGWGLCVLAQIPSILALGSFIHDGSDDDPLTSYAAVCERG